MLSGLITKIIIDIDSDGFTDIVRYLGGMVAILFALLFFFTGMGAALTLIPGIYMAIFGKPRSTFIINPQGIVLLSGGYRFRKKLLPWDLVNNFHAKTSNQEVGGNFYSTETTYVYSGSLGGVGVATAAGAEAVGQVGGAMILAAFTHMKGRIIFTYKNHKIVVAKHLSDEEAMILLNTITAAAHVAVE